ILQTFMIGLYYYSHDPRVLSYALLWGSAPNTPPRKARSGLPTPNTQHRRAKRGQARCDTLKFPHVPARVSESFVLRSYPFKEADLVVSFLTRDQEAARRGQAGAPSEERVRRRIGTALASAHVVFPTRDQGTGEPGFLRTAGFPIPAAVGLPGGRGAGLFRGSYRSVTAAGRTERPVLPPADHGAGTHA